MTTSVDPHVQALRDALVAEHEAHLAELRQRVDEAAARGDEWYRKWHQNHLDRLRAMSTPYPWETKPTDNA